jgi:NitT/TauT family transport system ATP-binding protein
MKEMIQPLQPEPDGGHEPHAEKVRSGDAAVEFSNVQRQFGETLAVDTVNLRIPRGRLTVLIGPSGCGKSTLLGLAAGLDFPSAGSVMVEGREVTAPPEDVALIFQEHNLFPWLNARDNVAYGLRSRGMSKREARSRAEELLGRVGLGHVADALPSSLSGGMRQRVALVRAFAVNPKVLLMDEPFGALDHQTRRKMQSYLLSTWKGSAATVLMVTHDLDEALLLADRLVLLSANPGRIAEVIDIDIARPRHRDDHTMRKLGQRLENHLARAADDLGLDD